MKKLSIWERSNAFDALKANHASLIIITFVQSLLSFLVYLKTGTIVQLSLENKDFAQSIGLLEGFFLVIFSIATGMALLLFSHYYNRYGVALSFKDKNFSSYLWKFFKRSILFTLLTLLIGVVFGSFIGVAWVIASPIFGKIASAMLALVMLITFLVGVIFLFIFSMMIYPPLLGDGEDKSFKTAFKNTKMIFVRFNKETALFYIGWFITSVVVNLFMDNLILLSKTDDILINFQEIIIFFSIYIITYTGVIATFITQTFASQYYFEINKIKI